MDDEKAFLEAIESFGQEVLENNPELAGLLSRFWGGELSAKEAVKEVWRIIAKSPEQGTALENSMLESFGIKPQSSDLAQFPDRTKMLERWGFEEEDLIFEPFEDRPGHRMLHPLLMGMIVELLQYDGDVPELRTGKLPEGGSPAVPVRTKARSPVAIGVMLRTASREIALELEETQTQHNLKMANLINAIGGSSEAVTGLVRQETERGMAVPGYAPGSKAQLREVTPPTASELAFMPFEERQELAHKALTSTQGRRSIVPVIAESVLMALTPMITGGISMVEHSTGTPFAEVEWGVQIDGGTTERNPNFNFVDTAAQSIVNQLCRELRAKEAWGSKFELIISPINTISERRTGWRASLYVFE